MGTLLVVGSVALDSVKTPFGEVSEVLGGSATYFATSASYFASVNLIAVVGKDFPEQHLTFLKSRGVNLAGLERSEGQTFRWKTAAGAKVAIDSRTRAREDRSLTKATKFASLG